MSLTVKQKSLIGFVVIAIVTVVAGAMMIIAMGELNRGVELEHKASEEVAALEALNLAVIDKSRLLKSFVLTGDRIEFEMLQAIDETLDTSSARLIDLTDGTESSPQIAEITLALTDWRREHVDLILRQMERPETIDLARFEESSGPGLEKLDAVQAGLKSELERIYSVRETLADRQAALASKAQFIVIANVVLVFALVAGVGLMVIMAISRLSRTLSSMEDGNVRIDEAALHRSDEFGSMARAAKAFSDKLTDAEQAEARRTSAERKAAEERTAMMNRLRSEVGTVVSAAAEGNFDRRVNATFDDDALVELGTSINTMVESVKTSLNAATTVTTELSQGNLTARMEGEHRGSFGALQDNLNTSIERLEALVSRIIRSAAKMSESVADIRQDATELAAQAGGQAASLEETAASMEEMTATIKANADHTDQARSLVEEAASKARAGGRIVEAARNAVGRIENSSLKINEIISVIESIAFQTNLLALNAAVEAARAGDAGKGFAVVASEVRTLAQRSSDAARDITTLIQESSSDVSQGVEQVTRTGQSLEEISSAVIALETTFREIAEATKEQSVSVSEISNTLSHVDQTTQQTATKAERSASTAVELAAEAAKLTEQTVSFRVAQRKETGERASTADKLVLPPVAPARTAAAKPQERSKASAAISPPATVPDNPLALARDTTSDDEDNPRAEFDTFPDTDEGEWAQF
ncbi:methyl-accepting chemotaxis protein [Algicella marina]|uniref:Methyl-accepting chemotaxis protein n=1 Tax=Algicella marina TaxID=2683284 RepID=A0A6P1SXV2_9RHOB|nr:methyl-accepting chemotaxis protein [Algicella marina]QHQ34311.1 hypothetical protein GO499_03440 [Algicella marina]